MNKALLLAIKDLRVILSDKGNVFWVFGFPVLIALLFGAIYSGAGSEPSGIKIALVDEDTSEFSGSYISKLESYDALEIVYLTQDEAIEQVRKGKIAAVVILKEGFGDGFEALFNSDEPRLEIAKDPSRKMESGYLQGLLAKAQFETLGDQSVDKEWMSQQVKLLRDDVENDNGLDAGQRKTYLDFFDSFDTFLTDINDQTFSAGFKGDLLNFSQKDISREYEGPITSFQTTLSQAILWGMLTCTVTFAISIVKERTHGTFARLRIGPLGNAHILGGKGLACFITCIFTICILFVIAKAIFKTPIGNRFLFVLAALCTALCFVGLMMFICTWGRTEQSVGAAGWATLVIMVMLGGVTFPLAFMPSWLRPFSHFNPVKWSVLAFEGAIWRNFSLMEMISPCLILLATGITAFSLGVVMLRKQEK
ncbi:MAG: ABC transporter permease [Desulfobacteraceae bacterium]|nr:ABC transporter permease [Desulfobacteraceae bacterium]